MSSKKKKMTTTALAVALAVLLLIGGGTFAYLQSTTDDVTNNFKANKVMVDLTESTGNDYNIVPGTEQKKDPKVTVNATVPAYVYVEVKDTTNGLVDYEIADGWTKLDGYDNVYYREVEESNASQEFYVLKDNKVTYSSALENSDMLDDSGNLKSGIELTFKAHAIQKEGFADAEAAYKQIPATVTSTEEATEAINAGKPVEMEQDLMIPVEDLSNENVNVDINGKTLTVTGKDKNIYNGESLILANGTVKWETESISGEEAVPVALRLCEGSNVTLKNIQTDMEGRGIAINKDTDTANLEVIDSTIITTDNYMISTNATNKTTGKAVKINVKNSNLTVTGKKYVGDNTGILLNVPGTLNIEDSSITADRQAVIVRCGTATIKDSNLNCTAKYPQNTWAIYDNKSWGAGNEVPVATLVIGNRSGAGAYPYDAECTLSGTTLILGDGTTGRTPVYAAAYNSHTATLSGIEANDITQSKDDKSTITIK